MTEKILCFYHANCVDGAASAAVIRHKYPQAECYGISHGESVPVSVKGAKLFIVDFSFDPNTLSQLKNEAKEIFWYDHHVTSLPTHEKLGWGIIDLKESGASLSWKQEFPTEKMPTIIEYVRDKDLYEWKLPNSREISMDLANHPDIHDPSGETWKQLLAPISEKDWHDMILRGKRALKNQRLRVIQGSKNGFEVDFHGHKAFAVNWTLEASDIGEYIYKEMGYSIAVLFYYNGEMWNFSLRSNQIDVSKLALEHGGGGHPGAAGFRVASIDWLLNSKKQ